MCLYNRFFAVAGYSLLAYIKKWVRNWCASRLFEDGQGAVGKKLLNNYEFPLCLSHVNMKRKGAPRNRNRLRYVLSSMRSVSYFLRRTPMSVRVLIKFFPTGIIASLRYPLTQHRYFQECDSAQICGGLRVVRT